MIDRHGRGAWRSFAFGLNPYGLTYYLGLQGAGGPRANLAWLGSKVLSALRGARRGRIELFDPWLRALSDEELAALKERLRELGHDPDCQLRTDDGAVRERAAARRAHSTRRTSFVLDSTTVLCGDRTRSAQDGGARRKRRAALAAIWAASSADEGRMLAIENHQDFGSDELVAFCEATRGVRHLRRRRQHFSGRRGAARLSPSASRPMSAMSI